MWETLRYHVAVMRPAPTCIKQVMFCPLHNASTMLDDLYAAVDREAIDEEMEADPTVLVMGAPALGQFAVQHVASIDAYNRPEAKATVQVNKYRYGYLCG